MFLIDVDFSQLTENLEAIQKRLNNLPLFFQRRVRPRLIDEFEAAYRASGVGVRTGRLLESYVSLVHEEHISEIGEDFIIEGTRVPYAVFVEALLPVAGRVAENQALIDDVTQSLGDFIVDGHTR